MKQDIAELRKRISVVHKRLHKRMGEVNYVHRLESQISGIERTLEQLDREIASLPPQPSPHAA
jgi:hypothetical protein